MELTAPLDWAGRKRDRFRVIPATPPDIPVAEAPSAEHADLAEGPAKVRGADTDAGNTLMLALQSGDSRAFHTLFSLYNPKLYSFTLRIVGEAQAAEDIVQETWVTLFEHRMRYEPSYRFSTWLFTIARRKALTELRRRSVRAVVRSLTFHRPGEETRQLEPPQAAFCDPDDAADGALTAVLVRRALDRLAPHHREIVLLKDVEGFENEELAQVLGWNIKAGALRKRVFDARAAFRRALAREGYDGPGA